MCQSAGRSWVKETILCHGKQERGGLEVGGESPVRDPGGWESEAGWKRPELEYAKQE